MNTWQTMHERLSAGQPEHRDGSAARSGQPSGQRGSRVINSAPMLAMLGRIPNRFWFRESFARLLAATARSVRRRSKSQERLMSIALSAGLADPRGGSPVRFSSAGTASSTLR